MVESFFELHDRPFSASPRTHRYYAAAAIEDVRSRLARAIERGEGPGMVVGPTGCGKTLLCHVLAEQFRESFAVAHLEATRICSRRALLQAILFELSLPYRNLAEGELRLSLLDYLASSEACQRGMLLILDEAHTLPLLLFDEIRMMTNLVRDGQPRARAVLVGSPALEEHFANPRLESFNQRLAVRGFLQALDKGETIEYVRAQLAASGGQAETILTDSALSAIHRATDGIPRLINQVGDQALLQAASESVRPLEAIHIEQAWANLQQLPTPWSAESPTEAADTDANVIEFGSLDALDEETLDYGGDDLAATDQVVASQGLNAQELSFLDMNRDDKSVATIAADFGDEQHAAGSPEAVPFPTSDRQEPELVLRLEEISEQIADIEEEFEPVATILPETDAAARSRSPFEEEFAEEEVVIDRYAMLEDAGLRSRRLATSDEGISLAQAVGTVQQSPIQHSIAVQHNLQTVEVPESIETVFQAPSENTQPEVSADLSPAAADPVMPEDDFAATDLSSNGFEAGAAHPAATNLGAGGETAGDSVHEVLIIEDEQSKTSLEAPRVRRQEYAQLFARLRRG